MTHTNGGDNQHPPTGDGYGPMFPIAGLRYCGDVIHLHGSSYCIIEDNRLVAPDGNGMYLEGSNLQNIIHGNEISGAGVKSICLIGTKEGYPLNNRVEDNYIHDGGYFDKYSAGVFLEVSEGNLIEHNLIEDLPHHAINLANNGFGRNFVEYNEIRRVCREISESAAINSWMEYSGPLIQTAQRSGHYIRYAGAIGVCLIGSHYENPRAPKRYPIYNEVLDNYIHHCGVFNKYVAGVFLGLSEGNVIGHNRIEYMPHHAINLGNSGFGRNVVEYNEIRHVGMQSCDKGAINSWMEDPYGHLEKQAPRAGHVIRYNLVADVESGSCQHEGNPWMSWGVYLDNYTSNCFVYGNLLVRPGWLGIYVNGGQNNFIENNIIVDALSSATHFGGWWQPQMEGFMIGNRFSRNIFYSAKDGANVLHRHVAYLEEPLTDVLAESDYNLFFNTATKDFVVSDTLQKKIATKRTSTDIRIPLAEWQKLGFDTHSAFEDPLFVNPQSDDYRLKPESPAFKLGFQPIDVSQIGPRKQFTHESK